MTTLDDLEADTTASPLPDEQSQSTRRPPSSFGRSARMMLVVFAGYLVVSVGWWWNVWSQHPTGVTTCACGDASLFLWFLEWPAYAIAHGHNPFFSTAMFHPAGVNLLSNTSVLGIGIVLAPVTWLFGPVATLNVAFTLGPALNAVAMFWLLRRWINWTPASLIGGLVFGFSPFVLVNIAGGHLMTSWLLFVPLIFGMLDEILVRQQTRPRKAGVILGLLVTGQFFISTEVLLILATCTVAGCVILIAGAWAMDRTSVSSRVAYATKSLVPAVIVAVVLLAYPVWFALDGPSHLSGLVWPTLSPGAGGIGLGNIWSLHFQTSLESVMRFIGGYQGPALPEAEYFGIGMIAVIAVGLAVWHRDLRLWFCAGLAMVATVLSLGVNSSNWVPWNVIRHITVIQNVIPGRFMAVTWMAVATMLAIICDKSRAAMARLAHRGRVSVRAGNRRLIAVVSAVVAIGIAAVATVPIGTAMADNIPMTASSAVLPSWFSHEGRALGPDQVVLMIPAPFSLFESGLAWQAMDLIRYSIVGGSGPAALPSRAGPERPGLEVLSSISFSLVGPPAPTAQNLEAVRRALSGWGVTTVVYPDPSVLPRYDQPTAPESALGLLTLAIGRRPELVDDAWVWPEVEHLSRRLAISTATFKSCTEGYTLSRHTGTAVLNCVMSAAHPVR